MKEDLTVNVSKSISMIEQLSNDVESLRKQHSLLINSVSEKDSIIKKQSKSVANLTESVEDKDNHSTKQSQLVTHLQIKIVVLKSLVAKQMKNIETETKRYHDIKEGSERNSTNLKVHIDQFTTDIPHLNTNLIDSANALDEATSLIQYIKVKQLLNILQK